MNIVNHIFGKDNWDDLVKWWNKQSHRWYKDGGSNQNIIDKITNEELRPRIGEFLQELFPYQSFCALCKWPWELADSHATKIQDGNGIFTLCEHCFNYLKNYGQEDKIRQFYHEARKQYWEGFYSEQEINHALDKEFHSPYGLRLTFVYPKDENEKIN